MLEIIGLANRNGDTPSRVVHKAREATNKIRCTVLSFRHIRETADGIELLGHEDYWGGSRLMIGIDKDGTPIWAVSSYDSGEGTMLLGRFMDHHNITAARYVDINQFLSYSQQVNKTNRHVAAIVKKLVCHLALEHKTAINKQLHGSYSGRELFDGC